MGGGERGKSMCIRVEEMVLRELEVQKGKELVFCGCTQREEEIFRILKEPGKRGERLCWFCVYFKRGDYILCRPCSSFFGNVWREGTETLLGKRE